MHGYYLFVGRGDWGTSREKTLDPTFGGNVPTLILGDWGTHRTGTDLEDAPEWSSAWDVDTWKSHMDFLIDRLGADTINLVINGYELPYSSKLFPEAVELDHANVRSDFLQEVLDHVLARGVALGATFCTTGHAVGYVRAHPEYATILPDGSRHPYNLCHNNPGGRAYAVGVAGEALKRYHGFSEVSFHPPENASPCHCPHCRAAFAKAAGKDFAAATPKEIEDFYWTSCMAFQREMETMAQSLVPGVRLLSVTIPGKFEQDFDVIGPQIPLSTLIMHWDYNSFGPKLPNLLRSLQVYRSLGHRVGFIPSSGWSLDKCGPDYGRQVLEQIEAARAAGITDIMYFVGSIWNEKSLLATSSKPGTGAALKAGSPSN